MAKEELKMEAIKGYNAEKKQLQEDIKNCNREMEGSRYHDIQKRIAEIDVCISNILNSKM